MGSDTVRGPAEEPAEEDGFDFPLFSGFGEEAATKISLKEEEPEVIEQSRPQSYYFASYSATEKSQFAQAALEYDQVLATIRVNAFPRAKVIDLDAYNGQIDAVASQQKKKARSRPGKRARVFRVKGKERIEADKKFAAEQKKLMKKKFHKRGGKKNSKKKDAGATQGATKGATKGAPVFRTE